MKNLIGFAVVSLSLILSSSATAGHEYLMGSKILSVVEQFTAIQESFNRTKSYLDQDEFSQDHLLWIQKSSRTYQGRKKTSEAPHRKALPQNHLLEITPGPGDLAWIHYHVIDSEDEYLAHLKLQAQWIQGDWKAYTAQHPFLLKLTPASQLQFHHYLKERFEYLLRKRIKKHLRDAYAKKGLFIQSISPMLSSAQINPHLTPEEHSTYFIGSPAGILAVYPNIEIQYQLTFCKTSAECEMNWAKWNRSYELIEPLISIPLDSPRASRTSSELAAEPNPTPPQRQRPSVL